MIIIMKPQASKEAVEKVTSLIESKGLQAHLSEGSQVTIVGVVGDKSRLAGSNIEMSEGVDKVVAVTESYKLVNKKFHPDDSIIPVGNTHIGPGTMTVMAGPCAIESKEQLLSTAFAVKKAGATFLRGGAYKPRTSPYSFQGLHGEGLELLLEAKKATGLPVVTEIMDASHLPLFEDVDLIQVGARNMQNFSLLKMLGKCNKPILLKRGLSATMRDFLMAAEYIVAYGNTKIILCERGIRTFETITRNTVDINAVPLIKEKSHLPIIIDASHGTGRRSLVEPVTLAGVIAGADGAMVEVHENPECAVSDGVQSLDFYGFEKLTENLKKVLEVKKNLI